MDAGPEEGRPGGAPPQAGPLAVPGAISGAFSGARDVTAAYPYSFIRKDKSASLSKVWHRPKVGGNAVALLNENGVILSLRKDKGPEGAKSKHGDRKPVMTFSRKSRGALMGHLRRVKWSDLTQPVPKAKQGRAFFVTLTYAVPPNVAESKKHLRMFLQAARRRWRGMGGFWKLESQEERAAKGNLGFVAHYHLLFDCKSVQSWKFVSAWIRDHWSYGRMDVWTAYGSGAQLLSYLGKYLGKETAGGGVGVGRYWGKFGKVPQAKVTRMVCDMATALHTLVGLLPENKFLDERGRYLCRLLKLDGLGLADSFEREMLNAGVLPSQRLDNGEPLGLKSSELVSPLPGTKKTC